jgi:hypothetical protein
MWILTRLTKCFPVPVSGTRRRVRRRGSSVEQLEQRIVPAAISGYEQYFLELINRARIDPVAEASRLGIDLNEGLAPGTLAPGARQPLALNDSLQTAIEGHLQDLIDNDFFSHTGSNGSTFDSRIEAAGYTGWTTIGENLAIQYTSGAVNMEQFVTDEYVNLFVDSGVADRGHRINVVQGNFKETGSGVVAGNYKGFNAVVTGNDFGAKSGNSFLTGVAYTDAVTANNFYNVGEGLGGVSIDVSNSSGGTFHTTANAAGGYQIALAPGTYSVTFSGTGITAPIVKSFTIGSLNVEVDVNTRTDVGVSGPPALTGTNPITYVENGAAAAIDSAVTISDLGRTTLASATITLGNFVSGQDIVGFVPVAATMGNIALASNSNGVMSLTSAGGTATLAQWQTALRAVTYSNSSHNPSTTTRNVTFVVDDGKPTNHVSNSLATTIGITAVNDAPVISGISATAIAYVENDPLTVIASTILLTDPDSTMLVGATVQITGNYASGQDQLGFSNTATISGAFSTGTGILTLTGTDTLANYQAALRSVGYLNSQDAPTTATRTISFRVDDGSSANHLSNIGTRSIGITAVNDPPILQSIESAALVYQGQSPAMAITSAIVVTDPDSANLASVTVQITAGYQSGADTLSFVNTAQITAAFDVSSGKLTLSGTDTLANYQIALRSVKFASSVPTAGSRTISFQANDGSTANNLSAAITRAISVSAGAAPVLSGVPGAVLAFTEKDPATMIAAAISVTDANSTNLSGATIQVTGNYVNGQDRLAFLNSAGITSSFNATTGMLSLSGTATLAAYQTMLRSVTYQNVSNYPSTATRTITFTVTDDVGNNSSAVSRNVSVTAVNDPPVILGLETTALTYQGSSPATLITSGLVFTDPDSDNLVSATVQISSGFRSGQDVLAVTNTAKITGAFNATTGTLTLSGTDSLTNYRLALRSVTYVNTSSTPVTGVRTVGIQANDGGPVNNLSAVVTRNITVGNGASPVISGLPGAALVFTEKDPATTIAPAIVITDADSANLSGATIQITGNYVNGQDRLAFVNSGGVTASFNAATGGLTLSGTSTLAAYQTMLRSVTYQNVSYYPGTATRTITFTLVDESANTSVSATRNVTVIAVNDPPVFLGLESTTLTYLASDPPTVITAAIVATDPDSDYLINATVQISAGYRSDQDVLAFTNTPKITGVFNSATGTLTLSGTDSFTNYRLALRTVTYVNTSVMPAAGLRTVSFQANDGAATNNLSAVVMRNISVMNGASPVLSGIPGTNLSFTEKDPATAIAPAIVATDSDSANLSGATIQITGNYVIGQDRLAFVNTAAVSFTFNATTGTLTLTGTRSVSDYQTMLQSVTYQNIHYAPSTATRTVSFTVMDESSNTSIPVTRNISITAVDDPSVISAVESSALAYSTNSPATSLTSTLLVGDPDSDNLTRAMIRISANYQNGQDILSFVNTSTISANWDATTGTLTLSGVDSVSNYRSALRNVMYRNNSSTPVLLTRTVTFQVSDQPGGALNSNIVSRDISIS